MKLYKKAVKRTMASLYEVEIVKTNTMKFC